MEVPARLKARLLHAGDGVAVLRSHLTKADKPIKVVTDHLDTIAQCGCHSAHHPGAVETDPAAAAGPECTVQGKTQARDTERDRGTPGQPRGRTRIPLSSQTPESSMKPETAGGRVLLLLLLAAVLTGTRADPVPRATRLPPDAKDCHRARFKSLSPQVLQAFRKAKNAIEEWLRKKDVSCSARLFPRAWDLQQLQVQERPRALQAELALTLKVLENMTDSALVPILDQPLHTLRHIHSQLQACTQPQPTAEPRPVSRRLSRWLHRLQEAQRKETPGCLEDSVTSNLFRLLIRDLKCVASGDQCA
ncbi:interferon lambda-2-like [Peromyscus leucopus]|uniref:interferon lambda-2-like n=1 Tax=Peromyscus leucopus TaxID=10041 RepID=UPI0010A0F07E|nr:interferon lambda-2-like [Peromyscus leucopus]